MASSTLQDSYILPVVITARRKSSTYDELQVTPPHLFQILPTHFPAFTGADNSREGGLIALPEVPLCMVGVPNRDRPPPAIEQVGIVYVDADPFLEGEVRETYCSV